MGRKKKHKEKSIHHFRFKAIRPFINFKVDLRKKHFTSHQKKQIKKYFDFLDPHLAKSAYVYRARSKKNLKIVREKTSFKVPSSLRTLKDIAIISIGNPNARVKVKIKNNKVFIKQGEVTTQYLNFDLKKLVKNPEKHVLEVANRAPNAKQFNITVGDEGIYEIDKPKPKRLLTNFVLQLMDQYNEKKENNYFGNWLYGLKANYFENQDNFTNFKRALKKAKNKKRKQRKKFNQNEKNLRRRLRD